MFRKIKERWDFEVKTARERYMVCPNCGQWWSRGRCPWCGFDADNPEAVATLKVQQVEQREKRRMFWLKISDGITNIIHVNPLEFWLFLQSTTKWLVLASLVGILAGTASAVFLIALAWATETRVKHPWLLYLLPLAGFIVGWVYWRFGGTVSRGNNLVIEEVNHNRAVIPRRMMPFVLIGTIITHLFGGSAGREGTAIQMGASLADGLRRLLPLDANDRRLIIMAGISGGFGSVFGVPTAGFVFGMEVQSVGRIRYEGLLPCLVASYIGDFVTRSLGAPHSHYPQMPVVAIDPVLLVKVSIAAIAFGLTSLLFIELTHGIKHLNQRLTKWKPFHALIGAIAIIVLTLLLGTQDYLGLSLPLIHDSLDGTGVVACAFLLKLLFTAITLGSGFLGGEVTPLFVIGSTLGFTLGRVLGVEPTFLTAIGLVAVFAGASNTPLACAIMGIELFGSGAALYLFLGCSLAYLASGHRGIYLTQLVDSPKYQGFETEAGENLEAISNRRQAPPVK